MIERDVAELTALRNAAQAFVATLHANGVTTLFGLPGSTEAPLLEALRADGGIRYVLTLQESVTVAMADGYARASGRVGVVGLHTSVGTMNGLSQLYGAFRDGTPLVVTAGHKDSGVLAADGFCAIEDLAGLARSFTKLATQSLTAAAVPGDLRRAINVAAAPPAGPTFLALTEDVQAAAVAGDAGDGARAYAATTGAGRALVRHPDGGALAAATELLLLAESPILILGSDASEARPAALALADALELPVFASDRTQLRELPYPVRDPRYFGQYADDAALIEGCDCVLAIGVRLFFPFSSESAPKLPQGAQLVHAHPDAQQIGAHITPDVGMAGDTAAVLADLCAAVRAAGGLAPHRRAARIGRLRELRRRYAEGLQRDRARADAAAAATPGSVSLARVADELGRALPAGALVFDEAVSSSRTLLRQCPFPDDGRVHRSVGGALGWAVPAAIGAKIARPDLTVVAVVGDGSFHFTPQALWTAARERAPIVVVIVDNSGYLAVKRAIERHVHLTEDPRAHPGTDLPAIDHVAVARGYGAQAERIEDPARLGPALATAMRATESTVLVVPVPNAR